jgi:hypothetical protein
MKLQINGKLYVAFATLLTWFALSLQFNISFKLLNYDLGKTLDLYFCYFTILTNIIAACCFTAIWLFRDTKLGKFFSETTTITAITVYILVVSLVYNVAIRPYVSPTGWARLADELLHVVNPIIFFGFWIFFAEKSTLKYKNVAIWLVYPAIYVVYTVIRGHLIGHYPYHFVNVIEIGYPKAILNTIIILSIFWLLSLLLVFLGKKVLKKD